MSGYGDGEFGVSAYGGDEITKFDVEAWCKKQPQEINCAFASHAAARALVNISGFKRPKDYTGFSFDLTLLRATLTSAVVAVMPTDDVKRSASSSSSSAAYSASYFAASSAAAFSAARSAAKTLINQAAIPTLWEAGLWLDVEVPEVVAENWRDLRKEWQADPAMAFWVEWYDSILKGVTPDWELWRDVVLIDDAVWERGPEDVAREIAIIQAARDLDGAIARLEDDILLLSFEDRHQGNRPEENPEVRAQFLLYKRELLEALRDIKAEREKLRHDHADEPDPVKLKELAHRLVDLGRKFLQGCALSAGIAVTAVVGDIAVGVAKNYDIQDNAIAVVVRGIDGVTSSVNRFADLLKTRPKPTPKPEQTMDSPTIDL